MFKINKITILTGQGPDKVVLHTDLPDGCFPYTGIQTFDCQVVAGGGPDYVRKHFNREPDEIIDVGVGRKQMRFTSGTEV